MGVLLVKVKSMLHQELDWLRLYDVLLWTQQGEVIHLDQVCVCSLGEVGAKYVVIISYTVQWPPVLYAIGEGIILLYLAVQFLVTGESQGEDGARASCMAYGFIPVLYRSETWQRGSGRTHRSAQTLISSKRWHGTGSEPTYFAPMVTCTITCPCYFRWMCVRKTNVFLLTLPAKTSCFQDHSAPKTTQRAFSLFFLHVEINNKTGSAIKVKAIIHITTQKQY